MHLIMFDIDGTLVESTAFDAQCYKTSVEQELKISIGDDWSIYKNVTDTGILQEILHLHNIQSSIESVIKPVQKRFFDAVDKHLSAHGLKEISGASDFLDILRQRTDVKLAMATGGWKQSAEMKLNASGIDFSGIPLCTSDDHHTRIGIMQKAEPKLVSFKSKTYFGDAIWDKKACAELKYDFIAIGNEVAHTKRYNNFSEIDFDQFFKTLTN